MSLSFFFFKAGDEPFACGTGSSDHKSTPDAVAEAAAQLAKQLGSGFAPSLLVVHATASHDAHALRAALGRRFPGALLHGASSCR